jgi:hypothetical protein
MRAWGRAYRSRLQALPRRPLRLAIFSKAYSIWQRSHATALLRFPLSGLLNATLILLNTGPNTILNANPFKSLNNPFRKSNVEEGFVTFGQAEVTDWLARVTTAALKAAWCQKWMIHRRLRPEALRGLMVCCGLHGLLSVMVTVALRVPRDSGRKAARTVQLAPKPKCDRQVLLSRKSPASVPPKQCWRSGAPTCRCC